MKPYSPTTNKGRTVAVEDVHHRTADQPRQAAQASAKSLKHAARQQGHAAEVWPLEDETLNGGPADI